MAKKQTKDIVDVKVEEGSIKVTATEGGTGETADVVICGEGIKVSGDEKIAADAKKCASEADKGKLKWYSSLNAKITTIVSLCALIAYVLLGFFTENGNGWHPWWILFIFIPVIPSIFECFIWKKVSKFNYPCLVTGIYLLVCCLVKDGEGNTYLWHPLWVIFLTIPNFYLVISAFAPRRK